MYMWFLWKEYVQSWSQRVRHDWATELNWMGNQTHILVEGHCYLKGKFMLVNGFSAFLNIGKRHDHKFSLENIYLRASSVIFHRAQSVSSWSSLWIPFQMYCRSATAVANDWILVELDDGQHSSFYIPLPFCLNFNQTLGDISWAICPTALMLILKSGQNFIDGTLNVLFLD